MPKQSLQQQYLQQKAAAKTEANKIATILNDIDKGIFTDDWLDAANGLKDLPAIAKKLADAVTAAQDLEEEVSQYDND